MKNSRLENSFEEAAKHLTDNTDEHRRSYPASEIFAKSSGKSLTDEFRDYIADQKTKQADAERQAMIDRRKDRHHDYWVAIFSTFVGAVVTLLVEHFREVVEFVRKLTSC